MSRDEDKLIRQLSLLSFLLSRPRPFTAREVQESVEGYADMSDETFARRFHADRADLARIGITVQVITSAQGTGSDDVQLYFLSPGDYHLPAVDFSPAERKALNLVLAALDGRFAYARPLRLALSSILRGHQDPVWEELERLPVAFAPDEDARLAGRQLSRLEEAVARGKTVVFAYPSFEGIDQDRTFDPYSLFLIQSHWYAVGRDHQREAIRTFRVGRIKGPVRFLTEKPRDFSIPEDYDPDQYRARPPWLLGRTEGTAAIQVGEDLAWWFRRLEPHVSRLAEDDGCARFAIPYADDFVLLSWLTGLGGSAEILEPPGLRDKMKRLLHKVARSHSAPADCEDILPHDDSLLRQPRRPGSNSRTDRALNGSGPIAAEHLARTMTLLSYLLDEGQPTTVSWSALQRDLGLSRNEIEEDLSLINLVNFGGGTYALTAESTSQGVRIVREAMADTFSQPARLSPVMARALLLALDLVGHVLPLEGQGSLTTIRQKVGTLMGDGSSPQAVIVDEVMTPPAEILGVLNQAISDNTLVALEYFTTSRSELAQRVVEPYLLFHSPDGWYLEAYCQRAEAQRTFKLERIRSAAPTGSAFSPRPEVDLTRRRMGGPLISYDVARWATVLFAPRWRTYLEEKGTSCVVRPDDRVEARIPYLDEAWLVQEVIRFLGDATLVHPPSARERIWQASSALAARYEAVSPTAIRKALLGGQP
jgi:predicted DNA-binding transcriptional regulator YafY